MASLTSATLLTACKQKATLGGLRFDWIMVALSTWLLVGAYLDSWAHNHLANLETFFTPWHGVLYLGYLAIAGFLGLALVINYRRGYAWEDLLPTGYRLSLIGVGIFAVSGVGDAVWHTLFGIERNFAVVLSPTHLTLTFGAVLMASGPLRAAWARTAPAGNRGWAALGPMVVSAALVLCGMTYLTGYANPFQNVWALIGFRDQVFAGINGFSLAAGTQVPEEVGRALGTLAIMAHTAMLMGLLLFLVRRWRLPLGSLTLIFSLNAVMTAAKGGPTQYMLAPIMALTGLAAEGLYAWLKPSAERGRALRLFAFAVPAILYLLYFGELLAINRLEWPIVIWAGDIFIAAIIGWGLSYLAVPPSTPAHVPA